jgi:hypothetical protein
VHDRRSAERRGQVGALAIDEDVDVLAQDGV